MTGAENGPKVVNNPTGTKSKLDIDVFISNLLDPKWAGKQVRLFALSFVVTLALISSFEVLLSFESG